MLIPLGFLAAVKRLFLTQYSTLATNIVALSAAYAPLTNGSWFVFGKGFNQTASYNYSTDGTTWTTGTLPASSIWYGAASATRVLVVGGSTAYYSDNGTTWTQATGIPTATYTDLIYAQSKFVAIESGSIKTSTDGVTWTTTTGSSGSARFGFNGVDTYMRFASTSTATAYLRVNIGNFGWTTITMPTAGIWTTAVYANGLWVAGLAGSATYATSPDGTTWTSRTLPSSLTEATTIPGKFLVHNNMVYFYRADSMYVSADGINWTTSQTFATSTLDSVSAFATDGTKVIAVGNDTYTASTGTYLFGE